MSTLYRLHGVRIFAFIANGLAGAAFLVSGHTLPGALFALASVLHGASAVERVTVTPTDPTEAPTAPAGAPGRADGEARNARSAPNPTGDAT